MMTMQAELEAELSGLTTMIDRWAEQIRLDETESDVTKRRRK